MVPDAMSYAALPAAWQTALDNFRAQQPKRGGAAQPWTADEDACILHNEHSHGTRVPWAKLPLGNRRRRWNGGSGGAQLNLVWFRFVRNQLFRLCL